MAPKNIYKNEVKFSKSNIKNFASKLHLPSQQNYIQSTFMNPMHSYNNKQKIKAEPKCKNQNNQSQAEYTTQNNQKISHRMYSKIVGKSINQYQNSEMANNFAIARKQNFYNFDEDVENIVYEICGGYDEAVKGNGTQRKGRIGDGRLGKWDGRDRLFKALKGFFHRNGYREKITYLNSIFDRSYSKMSVGLIFTLLSEWSKKKYLTVLSSKIKDIKSTYHQQLSYSPSTQRLTSIESVSHKTTHLTSLTQKKSHSLLPTDHTHMQSNSSHTEILQRINKLGTVNSSKMLTIYNRATLYGYFIDELEEYYNLSGIEQLDHTYIKLIPKRKMKQNLCFVQNMNRATQVLIQSSTNKEQRIIIKEYLYKYKIYKEEMRKIKIRKMEEKNSKNKSVRTMSDHIQNTAGKNNQEKKFSVDLQILRDNGNGGGETYGFSIELQPNMSSSLLNLSRENQEYEHLKQSILKKIKNSQASANQNMFNFDKGANKNKIKFPTLSRSMDKKQKTREDYPQKSKLYRFLTNESQSMAEKQEETKSSLFKFSQRQTIKGIIIKNFLSNREKQKMSKLKHSQVQQLYIKNKQQQNSKRNSSKIQLQKKIIESADLRSLRQKTKALLKNFRTIQNY